MKDTNFVAINYIHTVDDVLLLDVYNDDGTAVEVNFHTGFNQLIDANTDTELEHTNDNIFLKCVAQYLDCKLHGRNMTEVYGVQSGNENFIELRAMKAARNILINKGVVE